MFPVSCSLRLANRTKHLTNRIVSGSPTHLVRSAVCRKIHMTERAHNERSH
jgi:hypothetical protein